jgi:mannose-6-phosphate isomerase-like protein (cupin superfamily)
MRDTFPDICMIRPEMSIALPDLFATAIAGNRVAHVGRIELGSPRLTIALAETREGAVFPFQYHTGGMEMAVIISGSGVIEVGGELNVKACYEFTSGDIVLVPPDLLYRVVNRKSDEKLLAWVVFPEGTQSYWPDGRRA